MKYTQNLFDFIKSSPTAYHTVDSVKSKLIASGYTELSESSERGFSDGDKHFVIRGGSSIIAFHGKPNTGFMICASHSDTPAFKLKSLGESVGAYSRLSVERYGGMIYYSWLDRPLSIAGRVAVRSGNEIVFRLVNVERDLLAIPSVAIHLNSTVNDGYKFNPAVDMLPLVGKASSVGELSRIIANAADASEAEMISADLYLYNREEPLLFGENREYVLAPRLDDLACVYTSLEAFLSADDSDSVAVLAVFDNEEVGSGTKQGANSTFLESTLRRIAGSDEHYYLLLASSYMLSADNAHAKHPNHPELSDPDNAPILGEGVVIKYNASPRYSTDGVADAVFRIIAESADVKIQSYTNRADILGGTTLGSIADTRVSIPTADIGLPQLAMHSACETAAVSDVSDMVKLLTKFYSSSLIFSENKIEIK